MERQLKFVTVTGADDLTNPKDLEALSRDYPFVEWGLLMSLNLTGIAPKYPSLRWLSGLFSDECKRSIHLCGRLSRKAFDSPSTFAKRLDMLDCIFGEGRYRRVQFNGAKIPKPGNPLDIQGARCSDMLDQRGLQIIFQTHSHVACDGALTPQVVALHDLSGGLGIRTENFDYPTSHRLSGFAGGLSPENVVSTIETIMADGTGSFDFWVDAEGRLCTNERLDLGKVEAFLRACAPYVRP